MKKKLNIFLLFIVISMPGYLYSEDIQNPVIKIGVYNNPPKIYVSNSGPATGYHIDIINAIFQDSIYTIKYVSGTWDNGLERLKKGEIDVMPDVAWSPERAAVYEFNNEYVLLNWACVYSSRNVTADIITDLDGKRIAVMKNSIHTEGEFGIIRQAENYGIKCKFIYVSSYDDAFNLTAHGNADAAVVNRLFGLLNEDRYKVKRTGIVFNPSQIKYAFRKNKKKNKELINFFDTRITELKADRGSVYYSSFKKYLLPEIAKEKRFPPWSINIIIMSIIISIILAIYIISAKSGRRENALLKNFFRHNVSMQDIRDGITDHSLSAFALFSIPLFLSILYHGMSIGWNNIIWLYLVSTIIPVTTALLRKHLTVRYKLLLIVMCMFFTGILVLFSWGRVGTGLTFFLTAGTIITLAYGKRSGLIVITSGLIITIIFGFLTQHGLLKYNYDMVAYSQSPSSWIFAIMALFVMFFTIISGIEKFYENLVTAVDNLEQKVRERTNDLDDANRSLHKEIDIRKKVEEELIVAKLQAEQASAAKGTFLASMTHEIRTPLNAILGYSQLLMREKNLPQESLRQIEIINSSGEHLLDLLNEILDMSKIEAGKTEIIYDTFSLAAIMKQIKNLFSVKTARKGIVFDVIILPGTPDIIITDKSKLRQILINLIGNAIKFTDNGSITVNVSVPEDNRDLLVISVRDTGEGIPPEFIDNIFAPFEQTKEGRERGGTGLGLPISRKFANMLGGDISVESVPGEGSCFTLTLKYREGDADASIDAGTEKKIVSIKSGTIPRILIVDDRDVNRDILVKMLEPLGFILKEASSGREAIEITTSWKPDLILLDLIMPEINGREVIKILKKNPAYSGIKIIVITASALEMERKEILELGADSFIRKPLMEISVLNEIKDLSGIEYNYSEDKYNNEPAQGYTSGTELADKLYFIPQEIRKVLENALITGDIDEIRSCIGKISGIDPELATEIKYMTDDFEFSSLINILKKTADL